jgi:tripartite-type tricarboxylate transporter receptor subunit TctC
MASAQATFPNKPITIVVPFTPSGGSDLVTRVVAQKLGEVLGTAVVVDNRAGAGGTIGSAYVARAQADGYTLISLTTSTHAIAPSIYTKLPYDSVTDFEPVGLVGTSPYVLALPKGKQTDFKSFVQAQKAAPPMAYASAGAGTLAHLVAVQFCQQLALRCEHVPYLGESASYVDLINGAVAFSFFNPISLTQHVKSGKLVAVAQTAKSSMLPDVPTFAELGVKGFEHNLWIAFAAPKGTPPSVVAKLNGALNKALADPAVIADLESKGFAAKGSTPQELRNLIAEQRTTWAKVAKDANVRIQ